MKKSNPETYNSALIDDLLDSISPVEAEKIEKKMLLAAKIDDAIKAKGWKNKDLLKVVGQDSPSVATKWLSGTHNFTIDTLVELEHALNITLLDLKEKREYKTIKFHIEVSAPIINRGLSKTIADVIIKGNDDLKRTIYTIQEKTKGRLTEEYCKA